MTISCEQCREWLSDLLEDEDQAQPDSRWLQPAADPSTNGASHAPARAVLHAHLATCADCACDLNMLRHLRAEMRTLPQLSAPADLRARVRAQLRASLASAPLLMPPVMGAKTLKPGSAANGHYRPTPQYIPPQPGFMTSLARFFSQPANMAWASGAALAVFGLVLFSREQPHLVMPPTDLPTATPPTAIAAPKPSQQGHPHGVATTKRGATGAGKKSAGAAATKPQSEYPVANNTSRVPDTAGAAFTAPSATTSEPNRRTDARHGLAAQGHNDGRHSFSYSATVQTTNHTKRQADQDKAATSTPKGGSSSQANAVATPPSSPTTGEGVGPGELFAQAPTATPPFARLSLSARDAAVSTTNPVNATQSPNLVAPAPNGQGGSETVPATTATPNAETPTPSAPGSPPHDTVLSNPGTSRIATGPDKAIRFSAPLHPNTLVPNKSTLTAPPANFGLVGAVRAAHLVVVPPRNIQTARLDIVLSSGLRYADQTGGTWRTVWHGAAQQGHLIAIDLNLVATAAGTQALKVRLMEISAAEATGESEDAKLAQSETLNLNVTAPNATAP